MSLPPKLILFDLDGTLADTAPELAGVLNRLREERGLPSLPYEQLRPYASQGTRGLLRAGLQIEPGHEEYEALRDRFLQYYGEAPCRSSRLFDGFEPVLARIEAQGRRWGVVTNKWLKFAEPLIEALGLSQRCACLIGGDTAARPKPAPDPLLLACERTGVKPADSLYLGDDRRDITAAKACGMPVFAALWGYYDSTDNPHDWHADAALASPAALGQWLDAGT